LDTVNHNVIEIALSRVGRANFENFVQGFFSHVLGVDYVPMGGMHDGGADGAFEDQVFSGQGTQKFLQASATTEPKPKIRKTVKRLREVGRNPKSLIYATNQEASLVDKLQEELSDELDCRIVIRDRNYFLHHINSSPQTLQAYNSYVAGAAAFLDHVGSASTLKTQQGLPTQTLCVFLGQELERRRGKTEILEAVADSLVLWALEGTDPEKEKFLSSDEIEHQVIEALPVAKTFLRGVLKSRLDELSSKGNGDRKINYHKKEDGYCLPFETREVIRKENIDDEVLKLRVSDTFRRRATESGFIEQDDAKTIEECVEICHDVINKSYHEQGLEIALFLEDKSENDNELRSITDILDNVIAERNLTREKLGNIARTCLSILRGSYYDSTDDERRYLRKLSRTYVLLFMLQNEPRVVEYFRNMTSQFNLYIGSDLIVRALSEHMLSENDQMTKNAIAVLRAAGSTLILTEKALDEVWNHFIVTSHDFANNYQDLENYMTPALASQIDRILIRAYFYAKHERTAPLTWHHYIGQFLPVQSISKKSARDDLAAFLIKEFGFQFEDEAEMLVGIDDKELDELASEIQKNRHKTSREEKSEEILCRNAALTVLRVYQKRKIEGERSGGNPYGFKTWWLTQQTKIQVATASLVNARGSRYMMRPEFILHFLASLPSAKAVQKSYDRIFPTLLGVKLGNRMEDSAFKKIISEARTAHNEMGAARAEVIMANISAQLQSDFDKKYHESNFSQKT